MTVRTSPSRSASRSGSATCSTIRTGDTRPILEALVENIGADRLLWGTDMPFQNRFCTYRQSRDTSSATRRSSTRTRCAALMGGTAARILRIPGA